MLWKTLSPKAGQPYILKRGHNTNSLLTYRQICGFNTHSLRQTPLIAHILSCKKDTLRSLRESKGLSQAKVADILGVSPAAYSTYEMGTRDVSSDKIVKLVEFYGITNDYLYGIEDRNNDKLSEKEKCLLKIPQVRRSR